METETLSEQSVLELLHGSPFNAWLFALAPALYGFGVMLHFAWPKAPNGMAASSPRLRIPPQPLLSLGRLAASPPPWTFGLII